VPWHRGTTAHIASIYPFSVQAPFGSHGPYVGMDLLAGGSEFCWDPFDAYAAGAITNPNAWVLGEPGNGKSALVKCLLWRMAGVYGLGRSGRWIAVADPKGEYRPLAEQLGFNVVRLSPGGAARVNPLAPGPADSQEPDQRRVLRQAEMLAALVATVLHRPLEQVEDAVLFAAIEHLVQSPTVTEPTLPDVAALVGAPTDQMLDRLHRRGDEPTDELNVVLYALDKLLSRSLRGMFDGPSTVPVRWDGPGLLLDLSAIPLDSEALPLVMVAAAGWLQQLMACPGPQRVQVLDEAWALLANRQTASYLQTCFKLGRTYGTANICITHRPSDLVAQADDGSATAKIAAGLLADSATKVILRQAPDQLASATTAFGLSETESQIVSRLARGRALWKIAGHTSLVQHLMTPAEESLCDTDARMHGNRRGFGIPEGTSGSNPSGGGR
jgi:type IV secretory pathway VirB4 component